MTWTRHRWDQTIQLYERDEALAPHGITDQVESWLTRLHDPASRVISDLGGGLSHAFAGLQSRFAEWIVVDPSARKIAELRNLPELTGCQLRRRDLRDLVPYHNQLDAILAVGSIGGRQLADLDRMLLEMCRCLREGGLAIGSYPASPKPTIATAYLLDQGETPTPDSMHEVELQYRLQRAGLRAVTMRRIEDGEECEWLVFRAVRRADN